MAKRYHASVSQGDYAGKEARRSQEMSDGGMIREDRSAIANLPQNVMIKAYPESYSYLPENLDDKISGIDRQIALDDSLRQKHLKPKKV